MSRHSPSKSVYSSSSSSKPGFWTNSRRIVHFKDEPLEPRFLPSRRVDFRTAGSMHAIASGTEEAVEIQSWHHHNKAIASRVESHRSDELEPFDEPFTALKEEGTTNNSTHMHYQTFSRSTAMATRSTPSAEKPPFMEPEPRLRGTQLFPLPPPPLQQATHQPRSSVVASLGPSYLQIYRFSLPVHTLPLLNQIKQECEEYASQSPTGWRTHLYSLTKQDIAVNDVPKAQEIVQPINDFVLNTVEKLMGRPVLLDWNQPHVLKYEENHASVPLHHDLCGVTVSIMLSANHEYTGGGCFLPALGSTLRLEQGEVLVHPGNLLHAGCEILSGTRYLLVYFCSF